MNYIQTGKQTPASLPEICAARTELMRVFDQAAKKQFIHVHASAGYGKTISTLLWLKKTDMKSVWLSLDAYDNTPTLFYRLFCTSILAAGSDDPALAQFVRSPEFHSAPVENTFDFISRLAFEERRYALVLDDFHLITNEEIKKSLPFILKRLPVSTTVILLSRTDLPDSFSPLIEQNMLSAIGMEELAFSSEEIRRHFSSYGRFITNAEAEKIRDFTEGWVIALNTIAISGNIDMSYKSQARSINSFIERNIWGKLGDSLQEFLMKTALPDRFSLELCQALTNEENCRETLNDLIAGNINISLFGTEYRYHNLFLDFLREKLAQSGMDTRALNKIVADYYLRKGDFLNAKNHAMKSGDPGAIAQTVRSFYSMTAFSLDEYIEFHKLYNLHALPDALSDKTPLLYAARIFFYYSSGNFGEVRRLFDKLYPLLPVIAEGYPESVEHIRSMIMLDCRYPLTEIASRASLAPTGQLSHASLQSPTFTFQLPFYHRCARDFYQLVDERVDEGVRALSASIIKENLDVMFDGAQAGLLMEKNRLREALEVSLAVKNGVNADLSPEFAYAAFIMTAEIYLLLNQPDQYEKNLKEAHRYIEENACQYLLKNLSAYEVRKDMWDGDQRAAAAWLDNYYIDDASFTEFYKIYRNFSTVRAYILTSQIDKAVPALDKLRTLAVNYDRPLDVAEADVLRCIADWILGNKKEARDRLYRLLSDMQILGFVRVVANEGQAVLPIITSVLRKMEKEGDTAGALYRFVKDVYFTALEQARRFKGITYHAEPVAVKLSARQRDVLELLAQGRTNAEIIAITGLTLNTIRTHTRILYQKLEVGCAADAVVKARQLGLI